MCIFWLFSVQISHICTKYRATARDCVREQSQRRASIPCPTRQPCSRALASRSMRALRSCSAMVSYWQGRAAAPCLCVIHWPARWRLQSRRGQLGNTIHLAICFARRRATARTQCVLLACAVSAQGGHRWMYC